MRITFSKRGPAKYLSHLELVRAFVRAFKRAEVSLVYSNGFHPMPKLSFGAALPVGTESLHETLEVQCRPSGPVGTIEDKLREQLPSGLEIKALEVVDRDAPCLPNREIHYEISFDGVNVGEDRLERFLASDAFPVTKKGKKGDREIDARAQVASAFFSSGSAMHLALKSVEGPALKPVEIVQGVFHLSDEDLDGISVLKIKEVRNSKEPEDPGG